MSTQPPQGYQPQQPFYATGSGAYATSQDPMQPAPSTGPGAPQPPKKSWFARHKVLTALLAVVAFIVVITAVSGGGEETPATDAAQPAQDDGAAQQPAQEAPADGDPAGSTPAEPADAAPAAEPEAPGIGAPVRDGKFEFTVTGVEAGVAEIGDEYFGEQAQGQFVLVHLTVSNIGDEAQTLFGDNQTLVDDQGRQHSANTMASIYLDDNDTFVNEINPGNTVEGTIVFDIPADAVPVSIELHDSAFSGGVSVNLR